MKNKLKAIKKQTFEIQWNWNEEEGGNKHVSQKPNIHWIDVSYENFRTDSLQLTKNILFIGLANK